MAYSWVKTTGGKIPDGAVAQARDASGEPLFAIKAPFDGSVYYGRLDPGSHCAYFILHTDKEWRASSYAVLMEPGVWVPASGGAVPGNALQGGYEKIFGSRAVIRLSLIRAEYEGGVYLGYVREGSGAFISVRGNMVPVTNYEVLIEN